MFSAAAILSLFGTTVACTPRTEKPAESTAPTPAPSPSPSPTEKGVRTNVTRTPMSVSPQLGGGNAAVPCGFGPAGGAPCGSR